MKKVAFITGVTGQDGSYLAEFLISKNYIVHGLLRRTSFLNLDRIQDIIDKYEIFDDVLQDVSLPYFADWLVENVHLIEIEAFSDEDAYTIFETMNDRK